jgi:hypothetical protein
MSRILFAAALLLLPSAAVRAQTAPAPAAGPLTATPAALELGREIARLLNLGEVFEIQMDKTFSVTLPAQLRAQPVYQALEVDYPGLTTHIAAAMREPLTKGLLDNTGPLIDGLAQVYATNLTEAELRELLDFYRSPAGHWLVLEIAKGWDASQLLQAAIEDPDHQVTAAEVRRGVANAMRPAMDKIPAENRASLARLAFRPLIRKLNQINPQLSQVAASWANGLPPEASARVSEAVEKAGQEFITRADAQKAASKPAGKPQ